MTTKTDADKDKAEKKSRPDGRRPVTLYLDPKVTLRLKRLALDRGKTAYELAEVAIDAWLRTERSKK